MQDQKTRNCLSTAMMKEIVGVIEKLESNPAIKVMILTHTGKVRMHKVAAVGRRRGTRNRR